MLVNILNASPHTSAPYLTIVPWVSIAAQSVTWQEYFAKIGVAQVVFAKDEITTYIMPGMLLCIKDSPTLMYIVRVQVYETQVQVYAQDVKVLLTKKALRKKEYGGEVSVKSKIEDVLADEGALLYADPDHVTMYNAPNANIDALDYTNVYDFIQGCLSLSKGGFMYRYRYSDGLLRFEASEGRDMTNYVFSPVLGNLRGATFTRDSSEDYNTIVVVGEDTNGDEVTVTVNRGLSEWDEVLSEFLDVRSELKQTTETLAEYKSALRNRGRQELEKKRVKMLVNGTTQGDTPIIPGDKVTVHSGGRGGLSTVTNRVSGRSIVSEGGITKITLILEELDAEQ